jgi:hypothetical protein
MGRREYQLGCWPVAVLPLPGACYGLQPGEGLPSCPRCDWPGVAACGACLRPTGAALLLVRTSTLPTTAGGD